MTMSALGVFDSGVGGLTVVREIKKRFPTQKIIYFGDTARVPYGPRGIEVIRRFALEDTKFILHKGVSQIVVACNTVSAVAVDEIRAMTQIPIWDMISPACEQALKIGRTIGVIGTRGTINGHAYKKLIPRIFEQACPLFVPFVEEGEWEGELIEKLAARYLGFVKENQIDTLILGCTHYPVLAKVIKKVVGDITLINCGEEVAKQLELTDTGEDEYYLTDVTERNQEIAERMMGEKIQLKHVSLI